MRHWLLALVLLIGFGASRPAAAVEDICPGGASPDANILWCEDFEWPTHKDTNQYQSIRAHWLSNGWAGNNSASDSVHTKGGNYCNWTGLVNGGSVQTPQVFNGNCAANYVMGPSSGEGAGGWSVHCISPEYGGGSGQGAPIYFRLYVRYSTNFVFHPIGGKLFYFFNASSCNQDRIYRTHFDTRGSNARTEIDNRTEFNCQGRLTQNVGTLFAFSPSNLGTWHLIEGMIKNSTPDVADGEIKLWVDGELRLSHSNVKTRCAGMTGGFVHNWFDSHQGGAADPAYIYPEQMVSVDNIIVSRAPIGALGEGGGPDTVPPAAPSNFSVRPLPRRHRRTYGHRARRRVAA